MALNKKIKTAIILVLVGIAFLSPYVASPFYDRLLVLCLIWAILAISLNLYLGFLGGLSLAYSAFFGLAGYTSGLLCVELGWATGVGLLGAIGICVVGAILLGIPSLRLKGAYFVMITIAFLGIVGGLSITLISLTNGVGGLRGIPNIAIGIGDTVGAEDLIKVDGIELYQIKIDEIKLYENNLASLKASGVDIADIEDYYQSALDDKTDDYKGKISYIEDYQTSISEFDFAYITLTEILGEIRFYYGMNLDETNVDEILSDIKSCEIALDEILDKSNLEDLQAIRSKLKRIDRVEIKINRLTNVNNLDDILDEIDRYGFDVDELKSEDHDLSDLKEHYLAELDDERDYYEERLQECQDEYATILNAIGINNIFNGLIEDYETKLIDATLYYEEQLEKTRLLGAKLEETELYEAKLSQISEEAELDGTRAYYEETLGEFTDEYEAKIEDIDGYLTKLSGIPTKIEFDNIGLYYENKLDISELDDINDMIKFYYLNGLGEHSLDGILDEIGFYTSNIEAITSTETTLKRFLNRISVGEVIDNLVDGIRDYYESELEDIEVDEIELEQLEQDYDARLDEILDQSQFYTLRDEIKDRYGDEFSAVDLDEIFSQVEIDYLSNFEEVSALIPQLNETVSELDLAEILSDLKLYYETELDKASSYYQTKIDQFDDPGLNEIGVLFESQLDEIRLFYEGKLDEVKLEYINKIIETGLQEISDYYGIRLGEITLYYEARLAEIESAMAGEESTQEQVTLYYETSIDQIKSYYETKLADDFNEANLDELELYSETRLDALRLYYERALYDTRVNYLVKLGETKFNKTILYYKTELTETVSYYQDQVNELEAQQDEITTPDGVTLLYENKQNEILDKLAFDYGINLDQIRAGDGKRSARLAERTPKDPTTDAFYKTGIHFQTTTSFYWLALIFLVITYILVYLLLNSRVGRGFVTVRDNEDLANSLGIYPFKYKMIGFIASAVIAGVAGWLYAHYLNIMDPTVFHFDILFKIMFMVIIGGTGTLVGPVLGAFIVIFVPELFKEYIYSVEDAWSTAVLSVFLLVVIIAWPDGIWGSIKTRVLKYHHKKSMLPELELEQKVSPVRKVVQPIKDLLARVLHRKE